MNLMKTTAAIKGMSKMVLECELRAAWAEVECDMRHGSQPSKRVSDYIALLEKALRGWLDLKVAGHQDCDCSACLPPTF